MRYLRLAALLCCTGWLSVLAQEDLPKTLQRQLIMAEPGDTIRIPAGTHRIVASLSMDDKEDVVIMGEGMDRSILSFKGQQEGAEGLHISHSRNIRLVGFTVQDAPGDCIKVKDTEGISFYDVRTAWTGRPSKKNGAYGFYPVSCTQVRIDHCEAIGASDAGIYVGQSHDIVVSHCKAVNNVAGIEIENSTLADVYECEAYMNTGGILVFDLPDLPKAAGGQVRVYRNKVIENNYRNFAPKGNMVGIVPPGTGVIILATQGVEVFDNDITNNQSAGTAIISYHLTQIPIQDQDYDPYPSAISIYDNRYTRARTKPTLQNKLGVLLFAKFGKDVPDILYDGIPDPGKVDAAGHLRPEFSICIRNNGNARFANIDAARDFKNISHDLAPHDCTRATLPGPASSER
ncbi:MAG: hypothetical protein OHK0039_09560 [Bacteroidia bacterium]